MCNGNRVLVRERNTAIKPSGRREIFTWFDTIPEAQRYLYENGYKENMWRSKDRCSVCGSTIKTYFNKETGYNAEHIVKWTKLS